MTNADDDWLQIRKEQALAFGKPTPSGFLVRQGSTAMREGSPRVKRDREERDRLVAAGILVPDENPALFRFDVDHYFNSRSQAAGIVIDGNSNGDIWQSPPNPPRFSVANIGGFTRSQIEGAMDAWDLYKATGDHGEIFRQFKEPRDYWVRSSKARRNPIYPTKPLVAFLLKQSSFSGGWGKSDAAARLHNSGFIVVDLENRPLLPPERYGHLIRDADRIRLCAVNYFIEPARERGEREVAIRASDIANAMHLRDAFPNICSALGSQQLQQMARVPAPKFTEPNPSSSTTFSYQLGSSAEEDILAELGKATSPQATNLILYGPPGTGKTHRTAWEAVRLCNGESIAIALQGHEKRGALMKEYQDLVSQGHIEFVTFHQSMSYEDFVEGRQPMTGGEGEDGPETAGFRLETVHGIFRRIAKRAETSRGRPMGNDLIKLEGRQVFKMSIGEANNPEAAHLFEEAIAGNYTLLGFDDIDWTEDEYASRDAILKTLTRHGGDNSSVDVRSGAVQMPFRFRNLVRKGDILIVSKGNQRFRAIGEFVGDYEFRPRPEGGYAHRRAVRWLWLDRDGVPVNEIYSRGFMQQSIYVLDKTELNIPALERYMNSQRADGDDKPDQFVLIIDEINRANISKVLGELITLLEADKRLSQPNALRVRLPYSGDEFGVPSNLHILGTMNTADRSIALLDTALRRRFTFREMMPEPSVLQETAQKCGVDLPRLLSTINERIEYLYDREHQIGHAYFTVCSSRADVDEVMRHKIIPLLAEYFFEDWAKIAAVLGDLEAHEGPIKGGFLERSILKAPPGLEDGEAIRRFRWKVRSVEEGFDYGKLVGT